MKERLSLVATPLLFPKFSTLTLAVILAGFAGRSRAQEGTVVAWGDNRTGQSTVPAGLSDVVAIASGEWHNLAQKSDGTLVGWGYNAGIPWDLGKVVAFAAGGYHNLAVRPDGTVRAWGENASGQANVPAGLNNVVAVSGGWHHSLALKADGTVVAWGDNRTWQTDVPAGLSNVVAIAAAEYHNLALKSDGTVVGWGWNGDGQISIPASVSNNVVAIAAGGLHSLVLKSDGTVAAFGWNRYGQVTVPAGLNNVVAIRAGAEHSLALKADGTVVGWGANDAWASNDPNCAVTWGAEQCPRVVTGQITPPDGLNNVVAIAAGNFHSVALRGKSSVQAPSAPTLSAGAVGSTSVTVSWGDVAGETGYTLERKGGASDWAVIATPAAGVTSFTDTGVTPSTSYSYRSRAFNGAGQSAYSQELSVTTPAATVQPPARPVLAGSVSSHTSLNLSWAAVANATEYRLERRLSESGTWAEIATIPAGTTTHLNTRLASGTTYVYRLRALNAAGFSPYSDELILTTAATSGPLPAVPVLQAQVLSHAQVTLSWSAVEHETGFTLQRREGSAGNWTTIGNPAADTASYLDGQVNASTTYTYRIAATNTAGSSGYSAEVSVTTPGSPINNNPLRLAVLSGTSNNVRVRISGESGQRFKVQKTSNLRDWTDVADSTLSAATTEITLTAEVDGGFFRTVNIQ